MRTEPRPSRKSSGRLQASTVRATESAPPETMRITGDWEVSADVGAATPDAAAFDAAGADAAFALAAVLTLPGSGFGMGCLDEKYV